MGPMVATNIDAHTHTCTHAHMGPMVATVQSTSTAPSMLTRPCVGFSPTKPQKEDGIRMEPPPSLPAQQAWRNGVDLEAAPH